MKFRSFFAILLLINFSATPRLASSAPVGGDNEGNGETPSSDNINLGSQLKETDDETFEDLDSISVDLVPTEQFTEVNIDESDINHSPDLNNYQMTANVGPCQISINVKTVDSFGQPLVGKISVPLSALSKADTDNESDNSKSGQGSLVSTDLSKQNSDDNLRELEPKFIKCGRDRFSCGSGDLSHTNYYDKSNLEYASKSGYVESADHSKKNIDGKSDLLGSPDRFRKNNVPKRYLDYVTSYKQLSKARKMINNGCMKSLSGRGCHFTQTSKGLTCQLLGDQNANPRTNTPKKNNLPSPSSGSPKIRQHELLTRTKTYTRNDESSSPVKKSSRPSKIPINIYNNPGRFPSKNVVPKKNSINRASDHVPSKNSINTVSDEKSKKTKSKTNVRKPSSPPPKLCSYQHWRGDLMCTNYN